ncbi:hypothetical protein DFJ74DRAFT_712615 [Hyaloraphidium curvatum]|nr:hypothetical protein DFJ74DRAFT_712615 [Hyaloraphidium curvatum]
MTPLEQFKRDAKLLIDVSDSLADGWKWIPTRPSPRGGPDGHLAKEVVRTAESGDVRTWTYHVVFSSSFAVPMLLLNVCSADGGGHADDLLLRPKTEGKESVPGGDVIVSQTEHPIYGTPYYFVHPCGTADLVDAMRSSVEPSADGAARASWLVTFLSAHGPAVGLYLAPEYSTAASGT